MSSLLVYVCLLLPSIAVICGEAIVIDTNYNDSVHDSAQVGDSVILRVVSHDATQALRILVDSPDAKLEHPLLVVVRQVKGVTSWSLPYVESGYAYSTVERTLCPLLNEAEVNKTTVVTMVDISTSSPQPLNFTLNISTVENYKLNLNEPVQLTTSPSRPSHYVFEFPADRSQVRVKFTSTGDSGEICAIASIQNSFCPVVDLLDNPDHRGTFQTMRENAAIYTELGSNSSSRHTVFDFVYIVVTVFPSNDECKTTQQEFDNTFFTLETANNYNPTPYNDSMRTKTVTITVETTLSVSGYVIAIVLATIVYMSFYVIALVWIIVFDWWRYMYMYQYHPVQKYIDKRRMVELAVVQGEGQGDTQDLEDMENAEVGEQASDKKASISSDGEDQPDMGIKSLIKRSQSLMKRRQPSVREKEQARLIKRPSLLDVLRGNHWGRALDNISPSSFTPPQSPKSSLRGPPLRRHLSEDSRVTQSLTYASTVAHARPSTYHRSVSTHPTPSGAHSSPRPRLRHSKSAEGRVGMRVARPMDSKATSARTTGAEGTDFPDSEPPDSDSGPPDSDLGMGMDVIVEEAGDLWGRGSLRKQSSYEAAMEGGDVELEEREEEREEEEMVVDFIHDKEPFPVNLLIHELVFEDDPAVQDEYSRYSWYLLSVIIFYGIPAFQLVLAYQQLQNNSGNQDICYYNTLCSHPWKVDDSFTINAFNNVFSNIGYFILGLLLVLLAYRRRAMYKALERINYEEPDPGKRLGVPQHFGIYYSIGLALMAEAFMSAAYHICPSNANYQFDTTYMYVLVGLGLYKLVECRCPDLIPRVHKILVVSAFIILAVVVGVLYASLAFYILFFMVYELLVLVVTVEIYYRWQLRSWPALKLWFTMVTTEPCPPKQIPKFVMMIVLNLVNFGFALYGLVVQPPDFGTYFLSSLVTNLILFLFYYWITKFVYGEMPSLELIRRYGISFIYEENASLLPLLYFVLAITFWLCGVVFYTDAVTDWLKSPASSRNGNEECLILDFYDAHDLWHFLSAFALFFSFLMLMTLDDRQDATPREQLRVF